MDELKHKITVTANNLFHQNGIRNVSIDNICSELRISKKTFYQYFSQKEDLVDAIISLQRNLNIERFSKNLEGKNAIESMIFIIKEMKKNADCESYILWHDIKKYYPKLYDKYEQLKQETIRSGFESNLKQGISEGYYRDDLDLELASLFHTVQLKTTLEIMSDSNYRYPKKRIMNFFIDLLIHLIANEKGLEVIKNSNIDKF